MKLLTVDTIKDKTSSILVPSTNDITKNMI